MIDGLLEALSLKALPRAGWAQRGVTAAESVASHCWGLSLLTVALCPVELDLARALSYAALHDLPEVRVGDLTPADGVSPAEKRARERTAMDGLAMHLPNGARLAAVWCAYEAQSDAEARFVKQLDRLDMALQAVAYQRAGHAGMADFIGSAARAITHPTLLPYLQACEAALAADS